ncbi:MAG TPA: rhomboid family intramembrane serine protease [Dehalococcoidia bacterium]
MKQKPDLIYNCAMRTYRAVNLNFLLFIIALNVLIFIIELITGRGIAERSPLISLLGLTPVLLAKQPWTIISSMFVHGDFAHILFNMISLYFLGSFLIRAAGARSFLAVFLLGGLVGNILYFLFGPQNIPGIGASGGIFAVGGALVVMVPRVPVLVFPIPVPVSLWVAIIIFLFLSFLPGIAWQAHVGGLLLGLVAGLIFKRRKRIYNF